MAEANDKRRRYRAQLRNAMIRSSVPGASDVSAASDGEHAVGERVAEDRSAVRTPAMQPAGSTTSDGRRVNTQEMLTQPSSPEHASASQPEHWAAEVGKSKPAADPSVRAGSEANAASATGGDLPTRSRSTPTQGTGRVAVPEDAQVKATSERTQDVAMWTTSEPPVSSERADNAEPMTSKSAAPARSADRREPARSLIDGGEHYRGATESDLVDAWREMRRQFGTNTQNKLKARTAMRDWLRKKRNVSPESVLWYGDFVAVRSCDVRTRQPERARLEDGWFLAVDPNRAGYRENHIFDEAFTAKSVLKPGAVDDLVSPAWVSEAVRLLEAQKVGKGQARPFVPGSIDDITSDMLESGEVT